MRQFLVEDKNILPIYIGNPGSAHGITAIVRGNRHINSSLNPE